MRRATLSAVAIAAASLVILPMATMPAMAYIGDQWILQIDHLDNAAAFTIQAGTGYAGPYSSGDNATYGGDSVLGPGFDGAARVYWELSGNSIGTNRPVPTTTELYSYEFYDPTDTGHNGYDPVEVDFNGSGAGDGEGLVDASIPWDGQFGTNHQWIARDGADSGNWLQLGPGPQAPESSASNAGGNGFYMWATSGSWLYAKYNFPFTIDRSWSALRVTQVTPEPASGLLLLLGGVFLIGRRTRRAAT